MINTFDYSSLHESFVNTKPFHHAVMDNFFDEETALTLSHEFPDYNSDLWYVYNNPLEKKKTCFPCCRQIKLSQNILIHKN